MLLKWIKSEKNLTEHAEIAEVEKHRLAGFPSVRSAPL